MKVKQKILNKWYNYKPHILNDKWVEFYNSDAITKIKDENNHPLDIAIIYSGRGRSKSFDISSKAILRAVESDYNEHFAYVRRWKTDLTLSNVEDYFADKIDFLKDITNGECNCFIAKSKKIYIGFQDEQGNKTIMHQIGNYFDVNTANSMKSLQFPNIYSIIYEEVFTSDAYAPNEVQKLMNLISTLKRFKKDFKIFLISNTVSRVNPYIDTWSLSKMYSQKSGTIDLYKLYTDEVDKDGKQIYWLIACEYLKDSLSEKEINKKEQRKNRILNIRKLDSTLSNKWDEASQYPIIRNKTITNYDCLKTTIFENKGFKYMARVYSVPSNIQEIERCMIENETYKESDEFITVCFVERKTTPIYADSRVVTDKPIITHLWTRGLVALTESDRILFDLIYDNRTFFCNNLVANEFMQNFNELRKI